MSINVIKATSALSADPVWIWVDQIVTMTINDEGNAVISLTNGSKYAITDTPDDVIKTIGGLTGDGVIIDGKRQS
jgi:uncharacterized protein YlzI (FlbEa/FlbD family)